MPLQWRRKYVVNDNHVNYRYAEIIQGQAQAGFEVGFRFPAEQSSGFGDVGATLLGIILGQGFVADLALRCRDRQYVAGTFQDGELGGVSEVNRQMLSGVGEPQKAFNLIADVTEAASLAAVAVDREVFAAQRLLHEVGNHT